MDFVSQKSIHLTLPLLTSHLPYNRMAIVCLVAYNTYPILTHQLTSLSFYRWKYL